MATSFKGWGSSWLDSWGPITVDPNALVGATSFTIGATGTLTSAGVAGTNLQYWTGTQWLIKPLFRWNGSAWVAATLKRHDGVTWI